MLLAVAGGALTFRGSFLDRTLSRSSRKAVTCRSIMASDSNPLTSQWPIQSSANAVKGLKGVAASSPMLAARSMRSCDERSTQRDGARVQP